MRYNSDQSSEWMRVLDACACSCVRRTEYAVVDEHSVDLAEGALVAEPVQRARAQHHLRLRVAERQALRRRLQRARLHAGQRLARLGVVSRWPSGRRLLVTERGAFAWRVARQVAWRLARRVDGRLAARMPRARLNAHKSCRESHALVIWIWSWMWRCRRDGCQWTTWRATWAGTCGSRAPRSSPLPPRCTLRATWRTWPSCARRKARAARCRGSGASSGRGARAAARPPSRERWPSPPAAGSATCSRRRCRCRRRARARPRRCARCSRGRPPSPGTRAHDRVVRRPVQVERQRLDESCLHFVTRQDMRSTRQIISLQNNRLPLRSTQRPFSKCFATNNL